MHPATEHLMQYFTYAHLREPLKEISRQCSNLAEYMAETLPANPETTAGLRKLLEAKDCFVRAQLSKGDSDG